MAVAVDPNATPCTHRTPSAIGLSTGGSESDVVGEYIGDPLDAFSAELKHDGKRRTSSDRGGHISVSAWHSCKVRAIPVLQIVADDSNWGARGLGETDN